MKFKERQRRAERTAAQLQRQQGAPGLPQAHGTPARVPLFPVTCDCGVELHDLAEAAEHECKPSAP
jgi:hypothetical protein